MGEPTEENLQYPMLNQIGIGGNTRGTETSKYPKEKKSKEIPVVAASELGKA